MTDLCMMQFLYQCGYWRASIQTTTKLACGITKVDFLNVEVAQMQPTKPVRQRPLWPEKTHLIGDHSAFYQPSIEVAENDCVITPGIPMKEFQQLFLSATDVLSRDLDGFDIPDVSKPAFRLSTSTNLEDFDRILIYTDGSSKAKDRHRPPLWNEERGSSDTWSFVVVGEKIVKDVSTAGVIGWMTHPVRYNADSAYYIGIETLGSYASEREALVWAGLWRLGHNTKIDTIFRTDSLISSQQADGSIGCSERDLSFDILRGIFQALETALPPGALIIEHIMGHSGELSLFL